MCGIAGYFGRGDEKVLLSMLGLIKHRGPDYTGHYVEGSVGIGSNRLSIIDLSDRGRQPFFSIDKSVAIVFNGEIYNFKYLKKILAKDYEFKSYTDTEVVLYSYIKWGIKCLERLNGMFAFVIYDRKKRLLFGARDRLGEKPLKYYFDNNTFAFSSEVKGLLPIIINREIDVEAIDDYLTLQYVPAPKTGLKNVYKLPAGHYFLYSEQKLEIKRYWSIDFSKKLNISEDEWEDLLFEKIKQSVESRAHSDVPLGAFLSGGLDSSTVVALLSQTKSRLKTFSIGFEDPGFDESKYAKEVAKLYGTDHSTLVVGNKELTEVFLKLTEYFDEPFADNSSLPSILLSRFARTKVKVALSGDGGDENFGGYERYSVVDFGKKYNRIPKFTKNLIKYTSTISSYLYPTKLINRVSIFANTSSLPFYKKYVYYNSFFLETEKKKIYSHKIFNKLKIHDSFSIFKNLYNKKLSDLDNAFSFDINYYLPEDLLYKMDIASMGASLEVRAPLLDHKLFELTAQMPDSLKVRLFQKKYLFKKILKNKKLLPGNIINRPKRGFVAPIESWMKNNLKELVFEEINTQKFRQMDMFDNVKLNILLTDYFQGQSISSNNIFALLSLASWINKYF